MQSIVQLSPPSSSRIFFCQSLALSPYMFQNILSKRKTCIYWAAAAAKSLQSCPTLCNPIEGSPPGSPVPGILQEEHWRGLPFPSPVHESEKWKWSRSVVSDSSRSHGLQPARLLHLWDFPGKSTGVGCHCLLHICFILILNYLTCCI